MSAQKAKVKEPSEVNFKVLGEKEITLPADFEPVSEQLFSQWVHVLFQNWRQGTVAVKGRADVQLSGRKPWKQKGTGRARAGTARSPIWRGGGVTFGPQKRSRTLKINKAMRKAVFATLLADHLKSGNIFTIDWEITGDAPRTKQAMQLLAKLGMLDKKVTLFLPVDDRKTYASFLNVPNVQVLYYDQPNAFDLAGGGNWLILKRDLELFKETVGKWL